MNRSPRIRRLVVFGLVAAVLVVVVFVGLSRRAAASFDVRLVEGKRLVGWEDIDPAEWYLVVTNHSAAACSFEWHIETPDARSRSGWSTAACAGLVMNEFHGTNGEYLFYDIPPGAAACAKRPGLFHPPDDRWRIVVGAHPRLKGLKHALEWLRLELARPAPAGPRARWFPSWSPVMYGPVTEVRTGPEVLR